MLLDRLASARESSFEPLTDRCRVNQRALGGAGRRWSARACSTFTFNGSMAETVQFTIPADAEPVAAPKPRRIAYLDHTASMGGGEIALLNLVIHLDRSRYEPVVVLFSDGPLRSKLIEAGIETHLLPIDAALTGVRKDSLGLGSFLKLKQVIVMMRFVPALARLLRDLRVDLVHTNSLKSDVIGGLAGRWARLPVLWHVRDRIDADYLPGSVAAVFRKLCRIIPNVVVANSAATLATLRLDDGAVDFVGSAMRTGTSPDEGTVRSADPTFGRKIFARGRVVHDGTDEPILSERQDGGAPDHPIVTLVGRITRWKGQHIFIRAAGLVHEKFPGARFRIVGSALFGETAYDSEIRELVKLLNLESVVEFTGFRNDVADLIRQATIIVHASVVGEPFGQVIIEAMAAERPVVATNGGGVPEIVVDQVTGLLVPMGDAQAMAESICRLLEHPEQARSMGGEGRKRFLDHFTIQNTAANVEKVYDDFLPPLRVS